MLFFWTFINKIIQQKVSRAKKKKTIKLSSPTVSNIDNKTAYW